MSQSSSITPRGSNSRFVAGEGRNLKAALLTGALAALIDGCYASSQIRKQAASDFGCSPDEIVVHELSAGYLARGCKKEAKYPVLDGGVERSSEITAARVDERPELPIDRIPNTSDIGIR